MHPRAIAAIAVLAAPAFAGAAERVIQVRSIEDAATPADPAVCAAAPFRVNAILGGRLWSYEIDEATGRASSEGHAIGKATACVRLTNFAFPPGLVQNFYAQFTLPDGVFTASGSCTLISNNVPKTGLVLAGCNLRIISAPEGFFGGAVTSLSTFNPFRLSGFATGSYWTLQLYDTLPLDPQRNDSDEAIHWTDDAGD